MLVPMKVIVDKAYQGGYGVPALPCNNELLIVSTIEAAVETNSPLIFLTSNQGEAQFNHDMIRYFADRVDVPVALCLDHSPSFEDCVMGIRTGCTAIMADRSVLPYEQNVEQVKLLADIAHAAGVSIEAELGHVGRGNNYAVDGNTAFTNPDEAKRYIEATGVDCLAVAIGTAHGAYVGTPTLHFDLLEEINKKCGIPLVLHGGSGSGEENIHKACTMGIAKVNIVTDIMQNCVRAAQADPYAGNNCHQLWPALSKSIKDSAKHMFEVTGCTGKAFKVERPQLAGVAHSKIEK